MVGEEGERDGRWGKVGEYLVALLMDYHASCVCIFVCVRPDECPVGCM